MPADIPKYALRPHSFERLAHPVQHIAGARRAPALLYVVCSVPRFIARTVLDESRLVFRRCLASEANIRKNSSYNPESESASSRCLTGGARSFTQKSEDLQPPLPILHRGPLLVEDSRWGVLTGGVPLWAVSPLVVFPPAVFGGCAPSGSLLRVAASFLPCLCVSVASPCLADLPATNKSTYNTYKYKAKPDTHFSPSRRGGSTSRMIT